MFITRYNPQRDSIEILGDGDPEYLRDELISMLEFVSDMLPREELLFILKEILGDSPETISALDLHRYYSTKDKIKSLKS